MLLVLRIGELQVETQSAEDTAVEFVQIRRLLDHNSLIVACRAWWPTVVLSVTHPL